MLDATLGFNNTHCPVRTIQIRRRRQAEISLLWGGEIHTVHLRRIWKYIEQNHLLTLLQLAHLLCIYDSLATRPNDDSGYTT